jgi:hypothetical protein
METNQVMKKLLATAALATLLAFPALAQTPAPRHHVAHHAATASQAAQTAPFGRSETRAHSTNPANDVYGTSGRYVGSDPDARVRLDLLRDEGSTAD